MNKKGFTLVELIATILILGLVMTIAIPAISGFSDAIKKKQHNNIIKEIEEAASKYAFDSGKTLIFVDELVSEGYYEVNEETSEIINPETNEKLNCNVVEMTKVGNYYTAEFKKDIKFITNDGTCDYEKLNVENSNINILLNNNNVSNNWQTLNSFTLKAISNNVNINCAINSCVWTSNSGYRQQGTNEITISNINILNTKYTFQYSIINNENVSRYTKTVDVKIDNEKPVIYKDDIYVYENDKVDIEASDGAGSGIVEYYFAKNIGQNCNTVNYSTNKTFTYDGENEYLICVKDAVGNIERTTINL